MTKVLLILFGIIFLLGGAFSFMMMFIYTATQDNHHNYLFLVCLATMAIGFLMIYKGTGMKLKD